MIPKNNLTVLTSKHHIPLENWLTNTAITMKAAQSDPRNIEKYDCEQHKATEETIDLTDSTQILKPRSSRGQVWIKNSLYTLHESDHEKIASPSGWLEDNIIDASQKLMAQHFPLTHGLEPPTLEQMDGFQAHTDEFLQIINIRNNHWIFVSNIGCKEGVVNVYDTMHTKIHDVPESTIRTIYRLIVYPSPQFTINMVKVDPQKKLI